MKKKIGLLFLVICSILVLAGPGTVQAAAGPELLNSTVQISFPASITFNVSTGSDVDVTDIRLHYVVNRMEHARIVSEVYLIFTPSKRVTTQWVWDMRKTGGLPPGTSLDYWWTVTDAGGKMLETPPATLKINDDRYDWRSLTQGMVTLYWYRGNDAFGKELMDSIQDALKRLAENTGAEIEKPVSFYIYANSSDLQGAMIFAQEWTGGVAFTRYGVIAIGIETTRSAVEWGKRTVAHELTHLVIHQLTFNPYNDLPTWLDEGLAMVSEGDLGSQFVSELSQARDRGNLLSVRSLASPFSAYADVSVLSYAQSHELVKYLIDTYGQPKMFELLNTFAQGSGYDEALEKVYGFDMDSLDTQWRAHFEVVAVN